MDTTIDYKRLYDASVAKHQSRIAKLRNHVSRLEGRNAILKRENHLLRNRVFNMKEKEAVIKTILKVEVSDDTPARKRKAPYMGPKGPKMDFIVPDDKYTNGHTSDYKGEFGHAGVKDDESVHANTSSL